MKTKAHATETNSNMQEGQLISNLELTSSVVKLGIDVTIILNNYYNKVGLNKLNV